MSLLESLRDIGKLVIKPKPVEEPLRLPKELEDLMEASPEIVSREDLNRFRNISDNRNSLYDLYDEMLKDVTISSAIEMYADDATQYDNDGKLIWVVSDDDTIARAGNRLLDVLRIPSNAWSHIYSLVLYGDVYLETFRDTSKYKISGNKLLKENSYAESLYEKYSSSFGTYNDLSVEIDTLGYGTMAESVEVVEDPSLIYDLTKNGDTVGFVRVEKPTNNESTGIINYTYNINNIIVQEPTKYVHISLSPEITRHPEVITLVRDNSDDELKDKLSFKVKRGKSVLHDIYKIHQELSLLEDSLLLNRLVRSAIIRLIQVEVGDMSKPQVQQVLNRVKRLMEQKASLDANKGDYRAYNSPSPIDNMIFFPTRQGKGQISATTLGGDVDIKSISDLDYFNNKLFGGLKIPKQYLGFTDDMAGFNGGQSLLRLDARYAKTIKKIQTSYISGITTLLNIFFIDKGLDDYVGKFQVKMVSPSATEDLERDEMLSNRTRTVTDILNLFQDIEDPIVRLKVLQELLVSNLDNSALANIVNDYIEQSETSNIETVPTDDNDLGPGLGLGSDDSLDIDSSVPESDTTELPEVTDELVDTALGSGEDENG